MPNTVPQTKNRRGFTLTELAIVLGIIGLILGAIWTAASKVYANNRVTKGVNEVLSVVGSVRGAYAGRGVIATTSTDLTQAGVSFGWYPADMIQTANCVQYSPCPVTPWGSNMLILANNGDGGAPAAGNQLVLQIQFG